MRDSKKNILTKCKKYDTKKNLCTAAHAFIRLGLLAAAMRIKHGQLGAQLKMLSGSKFPLRKARIE